MKGTGTSVGRRGATTLAGIQPECLKLEKGRRDTATLGIAKREGEQGQLEPAAGDWDQWGAGTSRWSGSSTQQEQGQQQGTSERGTNSAAVFLAGTFLMKIAHLAGKEMGEARGALSQQER